MGRCLDIKGKKYRVWTGVSDGWLTGWLTKDEMKSYIAHEARIEYKKKLVEDLWLFPYHWQTKDRKVLFCSAEDREAHFDWQMDVLNEERDWKKYERILDDKIEELTKDLPDFYSIP